MATINTKIESLKVSGQSLAATLSSTNAQAKFEIMLDGWGKWREVSKTFTLNDLNPGDRMLSARSYSRKGVPDATPATRTFTVLAPEEPPPPPPPPPTSGGLTPGDLPLLKALNRKEDWNADVTAGPGRITNEGGTNTIRYFQPSDGERTELQVHRPEDGGVPAHGYEAFYDAEIMLPSGPILHPWGWNTCWQIHGNNNAGYTGGLSISTGSEILHWRIKGGRQLSTSGSHEYDYDSDHVPMQKMIRGQWHRVRWHALWTDKTVGFCRVQMDNGPITERKSIPTASNIADVQMFRHGWYPHVHEVDERGPLDLYTRNTKVYGKPHPV
jgi:polysaccharide lyase-like protein